jgi:hypothetical protein
MRKKKLLYDKFIEYFFFLTMNSSTTQADPMCFLFTKYACYKKNKVCVLIIDESGYWHNTLTTMSANFQVTLYVAQYLPLLVMLSVSLLSIITVP